MIWPFGSQRSEKYLPTNGFDDLSRRQAFWLIKKFSSIQAWGKKYDAYKRFSEEMEKLANLPEQTDDSFFRFRYKEVLDELIQFEKAFAKLKRGDRSCFKWGVNGSFAHTYEMRSYISRVVYDEREYIIDEDTTQLKAALENLSRQIAGMPETNIECQPRRPWIASWLDEEGVREQGPYPVCYPLPEVPVVHPLVQIKTGQKFPATGIWEPDVSGAPMDYLLAGMEAPEVEVSYKRGRERTVWTLLWEDHRYEDGSVPEEEALYFAAPEAPVMPNSSAPVRCEANQHCPRAGFWFTPAKSGSRRRFEAGDLMPDFQSSYGATIWQWDQNQQE